MWLFYYFNFERNYDNLKSKGPCILLNFFFFNVHKYQLDFSPIVDISYEFYEIICDIRKVSLQ